MHHGPSVSNTGHLRSSSSIPLQQRHCDQRHSQSQDMGNGFRPYSTLPIRPTLIHFLHSTPRLDAEKSPGPLANPNIVPCVSFNFRSKEGCSEAEFIYLIIYFLLGEAMQLAGWNLENGSILF